MRHFGLVLTLGFWLLGVAQGTEQPPSSPIGRQIDAFTLATHQGAPYSLQDQLQGKAVVVAFLGTECPLANLYARRLVKLHEEFAPQGVSFLAIDSNQQDTNADIGFFAKRHGFAFPLLRDKANEVADRFGATRTPEAFVLDRQRRIVYHGRIDDQYGIQDGKHYQKRQPTREDLRLALDAILSQRPIETAETVVSGCLIGRVRPVARDSQATWCKDIVPIVQRRCQYCHRPGQIGPFSMMEYEHVVGWGETILEVVEQGRMPPWSASPAHGKFSNDPTLSDHEKSAIREWVRNGCPQGDPKDLPPPAAFPQGWRLQDPDQIVYIRDEPFPIPAEGLVDYQYFVVDPGWTEDKSIIDIEPRPDAKRVVHHFAVFIKPKGDFFALRRQGKVTEITGYVPGLESSFTSDATQQAEASAGASAKAPPSEANQATAAAFDSDLIGIPAPAGSEIVFEMHYTPDGTAEQDRTSIAIEFAKPRKPAPVAAVGPAVAAAEPAVAVESPRPSGLIREVGRAMAEATDFAIPARANDYPVECWHTFLNDAEIQTLNAHMHWRGKTFRFDILLPNGERETLLDIPRYDFDWQLLYNLAQPRRVPRGTRLYCHATFDNSPDNPRNPDPDRIVSYGHQSWEEMCAGTLQVVHIKDPHEDPTDVLAGYLDVKTVPADKRSRYYFQRANYRKLKNDLAGAVADLDLAVVADPENVEALIARGVAYRELRNGDGALDSFRKALAIDPRNAKAHYELGLTYIAGNLPLPAIEELTRAIESDPLHASAYYQRSVARGFLLDVPGRMADLDHLLARINPGHLPALWSRARLRLKDGRYEQARDDFQMYLDRDPVPRGEINLQLGMLAAQQQRNDDAERHFRAVLKAPPEFHGQGHFMLAMLYLRNKRFADAEAELTETVKLQPELTVARLNLAALLAKRNRNADAAEHFAAALERDPKNPQVANDYAWFLATTADSKTRNPSAAVKLAEQACQATSHSNPGILDTLSAAYAAAGRFPDAVSTADKALALAKKSNSAALVSAIEQHRRLYQQSRPLPPDGS